MLRAGFAITEAAYRPLARRRWSRVDKVRPDRERSVGGEGDKQSRTARAELDGQIARMVRTLRYQRMMLLAIGLLWFACEAITLSAL